MCLYNLMLYEKENPKGLWKPAIDGRILPLLLDLFPPADEKTSVPLLGLSGNLLLVAPTNLTELWAPRHMRAIARRLTDISQPIAHGPALEMLFEISIQQPKLVKDWQSWGIENSLEQLTMHNDPDMKTVAVKLKIVLSCVEEDPDVSLAPSHQVWSFPSFSLPCNVRELRLMSDRHVFPRHVYYT
jgi:hypothetical protein